MKKKDYTVTIMVVVGLFLLTMALIVAIAPERPMVKPIVTVTHKLSKMGQGPYLGRAHVEAIDQKVAGKAIILSSALKENGYIIIHKEEKGKPGKIIGVSKILAPGLYSNSSIDLTESVASGETLVAMLHQDDGDGVFFAEKDAPMKGDGMMSGSGMVEFMAI